MPIRATLRAPATVALLAEGVDRNTTPSGKSVDAKKVALLAEGVDRNFLTIYPYYTA